jgi:hypothetical protein
MKKITLLVASILLLGNVATASELSFTDVATTRFNNDEPITFTERGIEFFVFSNGDFDFNTRPNDTQGDYFFKGAGKKENKGRRPQNFGVLIEHDSFGRVRRVGNTFINYDFSDRVTRIGSIYMKYNRFALAQIGGMRLVYNRFGDVVDTVGSIKGFRNHGFTNTRYENTDYCDLDYNTTNNSGGDYYYKASGTRATTK